VQLTLIHLFLCFLLHDSVAFLNSPNQLIPAATHYFEIIVSQFPPLFLRFARILLPFSCNLIPVPWSLLSFGFWLMRIGSTLQQLGGESNAARPENHPEG
jgi:hypothetical protein